MKGTKRKKARRVIAEPRDPFDDKADEILKIVIRMNEAINAAIRMDRLRFHNLRDRFAMAAIGLFSLDRAEMIALRRGCPPDHETVAEFCYGLADAMMQERAKGLEAKTGTSSSAIESFETHLDEGLSDLEAGRVVDMDKALSEEPTEKAKA